MSFYPVHFVGSGMFRWQGALPRKAETIAHLFIDKTLRQFGNLNAAYQQLEPYRIVEQIVSQVTPRLDEYIDEAMYKAQPVLWDNLPPILRKRIYQRAKAQLPSLIEALVDDFGDNLDELVDLKALLSHELTQHPDLMNRLFKQAGPLELKAVVNSGALIGGALGCVLASAWWFYPTSWLLPAGGLFIGFITNWFAISWLFAPLKSRRFLFWSIQGLFLRRQPEISDVWAKLVSEELLTVEAVANAMINGSRGDRTRAIIQKHLRPLLDSSPLMKLGAQLTVGMSGYVELKKAMNQQALIATHDVFNDPAFNKDRAPVIARVLSGQTQALRPAEFQDILRSAFREEAGTLMLIGGLLGALVGAAQFIALTYP